MATRIGQILTPPSQGAPFGLISPTQASWVIRSIFTACLGGSLYYLYKNFKAACAFLPDLGQQLKFIKCQALLAEVEATDQTVEKRSALLADCLSVYASLSGKNKDNVGLRLAKNYLAINPYACYAIAEGLSSHWLLFEAAEYIREKKSDAPKTIIASLLRKAYATYNPEPITEETAFSHLATSLKYAKACVLCTARQAADEALTRALRCGEMLVKSDLHLPAICNFIRYYHGVNEVQKKQAYIEQAKAAYEFLDSPLTKLQASISLAEMWLEIGDLQATGKEMERIRDLAAEQTKSSVPSKMILELAQLLNKIRQGTNSDQFIHFHTSLNPFINKMVVSAGADLRLDDNLNIVRSCFEVGDTPQAKWGVDTILEEINNLPDSQERIQTKCLCLMDLCAILHTYKSPLDNALKLLLSLYDKLSPTDQLRNFVGIRILTLLNDTSCTEDSKQFFDKKFHNATTLMATLQSDEVHLLPEQQETLLKDAKILSRNDSTMLPIIASRYLKTDRKQCFELIELCETRINTYWAEKALKTAAIALLAFGLYCYGIKKLT
jgi:hypothetical protein